MKKILYCCTVPDLECYSIGVLSTIFLSTQIDAHAFVYLKATDKRSRVKLLKEYGIPSKMSGKVVFEKLDQNKIRRISSANKYLKAVAEHAHKMQIPLVHFLSQDVMLAGNISLFEKFNLYYTVHDLVPHEAKLSPLQRLKHYYLRIRKDQYLIKNVRTLVTNSIHQKNALEQMYPQKNIKYHHMPSSVSPAVATGELSIKELFDFDNYVLFFGRIEVYKGIEKLYNTFITDPLLKGIQLVIAGRGNVYFERNPEKEQNILFINRFIKDEEIAHLFLKAKMSILPYLSATQSAVTSFAYHFQRPVISSDISGLKETVIAGETGLLYDPAIEGDMAAQIQRMMTDELLYKHIQANLQVQNPFYDMGRLLSSIEAIY
jgi:glycosyltransferase involved in cell wall biosynthesis